MALLRSGNVIERVLYLKTGTRTCSWMTELCCTNVCPSIHLIYITWCCSDAEGTLRVQGPISCERDGLTHSHNVHTSKSCILTRASLPFPCNILTNRSTRCFDRKNWHSCEAPSTLLMHARIHFIEKKQGIWHPTEVATLMSSLYKLHQVSFQFYFQNY